MNVGESGVSSFEDTLVACFKGTRNWGEPAIFSALQVSSPQEAPSELVARSFVRLGDHRGHHAGHDLGLQQALI